MSILVKAITAASPEELENSINEFTKDYPADDIISIDYVMPGAGVFCAFVTYYCDD